MLRPNLDPALRSSRRLAGRALSVFVLCVVFAGAAAAEARLAETPPDPPVLHFDASGEHAFASGRITVDARLAEGAELTVRLTSPSGQTETLSMTREGHRFSWTGHLTEAGTWRAEAVVEGAEAGNGSDRARAAASASLPLLAGAPTCSVTVSAPESPTPYLGAEIMVNTCDATAATGEIATRYARIFRDGVEVSTLDSSDACERRFVLPGGGNYEASLEVVDDRGVSGTCSSPGLGVDARYPRFWPILDLAGGTYRSARPDIPEPRSSPLGGAGVGIMIPHTPGEERTTAFGVRAGAGLAHNRWGGSSLDLLLSRLSPRGFLGAGAGVWGLGDPDILDGVIFGTGGFNLDGYTGAGQAQAFFEVRMFARHITELRDNFSAAIGLRLNFKPTHLLQAR